MKVSAVIIAYNEADNIEAACQSVKWADEIVVVDSESTDKTGEIAAACGARVAVQKWLGFARQKQFASEQARHEWIFSLDADERVSDELIKSIAQLKTLDDELRADGYRIARRSFYMNRWIRGGGWYPDWQLRLYRKSRGTWMGAHVHESVKMNEDARVEILSGDLLHYSIKSPAEHHRMIGERYAPLAARQAFEAGKRTNQLKIMTAAPLAFIRSYFLKTGFRDGLAGYSIARFAAHHAFMKQILLWEMQESEVRSQESEHNKLE